MSVLTDVAIQRERVAGNIVIKPWRVTHLNPNSYNVCWGDRGIIYRDKQLDMYHQNPTEEFIIPESGYLMVPGELYLLPTVEWTETYNLIPMIEGRSSIARLGISIHVTAGVGDIGFQGRWTLEVTVVKEVVVYPNKPVAQLIWYTPDGISKRVYHGKYQLARRVEPSRLYMEPH